MLQVAFYQQGLAMNLTDTFFTHFEALEDPREDNHNRLHNFYDILVIAVLGTICGADGWTEICEFAKARFDWLKTFLALPHGIPSHDTFGRVFSLLDAETFESCFLTWIASLSIDLKKEIISIDGKSLRGSHDSKKGQKMLHVVSAWASENRMLLGQVRTEEKSNEITAIPELLDMIDVEGSIVTIDAMGCQQEIAKKIVGKGADFVLSLKENQPALYRDVVSIFERGIEEQFKNMLHKQKLEKVRCHGRIETRRYTLIMPREQELFGLRWPHLSSIGMLEVTRRVKNEVEYSKRFFLTSIDDGYELFLMSDLPLGTVPEKGKLYVEQSGTQLRYIVQAPNGDVVDSFLNIKIDNLNRKKLAESKLRILAETAKKGHTLRDQDIDTFMRAVRKHWNVEINLHWSLDVSFKEDLSRVRIGDAAENLAVIRRVALNLLKQEKTSKVGITARRKRAGWDNEYLLKVLMADSNFRKSEK
ncbi:MAG: ISAs1 family transposase [Alphaproteobacteria bacterium]|nr:MAG: ISAs1 family transposase [Alphaproteobacteria bacterium]